MTSFNDIGYKIAYYVEHKLHWPKFSGSNFIRGGGGVVGVENIPLQTYTLKNSRSSIYVPTQVGTLTQVVTGSTYVNTNLSVDPFDAIFDPTENPVFQNETWDGWPIKWG